MSAPKRHHYVPRFYLNGFTNDDGLLFAHDLDTGSIRKGTVTSEGAERHFYRVSGADETRIEKQLSEIEGHAATIIRQIRKSQDLPCNRADFDALLFFVALQSQRVVKTAEDTERWLVMEARRLLGETTDKEEEVFRLAREDLIRDGYTPTEPRLLDELGATLVNGRIVIDRDYVIAQMMGGAKTVFEILSRRDWILAVLPNGMPDLITSDSPVNAVRRTDAGASAVNMGYHFSDRIVTYPLTRRLGLLGFADKKNRYSAAPASEPQVALFNWAALMGSRKFAWSRRPRIYHVAGEGIRNETSYIVSLRQKRSASG